MRPFDKNSYLRGEEVITRDGRPVRILCTDRKTVDGNNNAIVALVYDKKENSEYLYVYNQQGRYRNTANEDCNLDLFMKPCTKTFNYAIIKANGIVTSTVLFEDANNIQKYIKENYPDDVLILDYRSITVEDM